MKLYPASRALVLTVGLPPVEDGKLATIKLRCQICGRLGAERRGAVHYAPLCKKCNARFIAGDIVIGVTRFLLGTPKARRGA